MIWLLAALTALRLAVAAATPLAPDEAYYWVWSKALAPGYFDHPPMVALWIRAGTWLVGDTPLGIRLLGAVSAALGTLMLIQAGTDLRDRDTGLLAALLLNATLLFGIGAVTMTPDTPLLFFWTAALWALARIHATGRPLWWLVAGLATGLAMASKYTAFLLPPGILLWLLAVPSLRPWLRRPAPWLGLALAMAALLPNLAWNAAHGWVSLLKQGGRLGDWSPARALQFEVELLLGQIGLATPLIALLCGAGMVLAIRRAVARDPAFTLLAALTIPPALVFAEHALGDRVQANWPSILYPAASLAAASLAGAWRRIIRPAAALGLGLTALVWIQAAAAPLALPMRLDPTLLRLGGWRHLATAIDSAATAQQASFIVSDNYSHAALLARLLPKRDILGLDPRWALFRLPDVRTARAGQTGLLVRSARRADAPDRADWSSITPLGEIIRARDGMAAETFRLYRVVERPGTTPLVRMPHPG
ncbi:MAG: glycosyltransferase family 39 protein [Rhodospirillales bacterium]|nr:glycosyltransferase family 39 protein [Rhodospirillales bacterium]